MKHASSSPDYKVIVEYDVPVRMRDGTVLMADVHRPDSSGEFPVLLERTPYSKAGSSETKYGAGDFYASRGYACVFQDVRGRFASEGDFYPFRDDGGGQNRDGSDSVQWAAEQPWSSGKVGTIGGSYSGATQYRMHADPPPALGAQFVRQSSADYGDHWVYRSGAFELAFNLRWATQHTATHASKWSPDGRAEHYEEVMAKAVASLAGDMDRLPLQQDGPLRDLAPWWNEWLANPDSGPYWDEFNITGTARNVNVPVHHLGGWYDGFLRGTLDNFVAFRESAATESARGGQHLTVGPWVHAPDAANLTGCGEMDFGQDAAIGFFETRLAWFEYWLKGIDTGIADSPPVRLFTMGANKWREYSSWPLPGSNATPYYLDGNAAGAADSLNDGSLGPAVPEGVQEPTSYVYDPANPVQTLGGGHLGSATEGAPNGQMDQRPIHGRVLTFTGAVLDKEVDVTGEVRAVLHAQSSARDTDWVVKLVDVFPDGRAMLVCDGVLRARYRNSRRKPELLSGGIERYEIDMWGTSYVFLRGHRIQVIVTSSDFPRWDRNMNTGGVNSLESKGEAARNSIYHDAEHPSHILLPLN